MPEVRFGSRRGEHRTWRVGMPLLMLGACTLFFSCKSDPPAPPDPPPTEFRTFQAPQDDLDSLKYNPSFEPDYNNLRPQPWVEPATQEQTDDVSVFPDRIEFPSSHTEVLSWDPGRIVVATPGKGAGKNGLGFAPQLRGQRVHRQPQGWRRERPRLRRQLRGQVRPLARLQLLRRLRSERSRLRDDAQGVSPRYRHGVRGAHRLCLRGVQQRQVCGGAEGKQPAEPLALSWHRHVGRGRKRHHPPVQRKPRNLAPSDERHHLAPLYRVGYGKQRRLGRGL